MLQTAGEHDGKNQKGDSLWIKRPKHPGYEFLAPGDQSMRRKDTRVSPTGI